MIYQLPNGRIIEMTLEQYLDLTDDEMLQLDQVSQLPVRYPEWMGSLGDDRIPGQSRNLAARLKKD